ncbi:MAG: hypothetical protein GY754_30350 [bacterium]|nr:hypothetical protein [bacterium]
MQTFEFEIFHIKLFINLVHIIVSILGAVFLFLYYKNSKKRWNYILHESLNYHKYHLNNLRNDPLANDKTSEYCKIMLWAIEKQYITDRETGNLGIRGILRTFVGQSSSLQIIGEIYFQIARYRSPVDERILKLINTLSSTFYRLFFMSSIISLISLVFMDFFLLLSFAKFSKKGIAGLYRDIIRNKRP